MVATGDDQISGSLSNSELSGLVGSGSDIGGDGLPRRSFGEGWRTTLQNPDRPQRGRLQRKRCFLGGEVERLVHKTLWAR
jgi:hypothetical protein